MKQADTQLAQLVTIRCANDKIIRRTEWPQILQTVTQVNSVFHINEYLWKLIWNNGKVQSLKYDLPTASTIVFTASHETKSIWSPGFCFIFSLSQAGDLLLQFCRDARKQWLIPPPASSSRLYKDFATQQLPHWNEASLLKPCIAFSFVKVRAFSYP